MMLCSQLELSLPMAKVIGPMPSPAVAVPAGAVPLAVQPASPAASMSPAVRTAIPGIARLMPASAHSSHGHVEFVHACYARPLGICQQRHITSPTCFAHAWARRVTWPSEASVTCGVTPGGGELSVSLGLTYR